MQQQHKQDDPIQRRNDGDTAHRESVGQHVEADAARFVEEAQEEVAVTQRPWYQTRKWGVTLLFVYAVLLLLFGILAWVVYFHPVLAIDVTITHLFQEDQSPWLRTTILRSVPSAIYSYFPQDSLCWLLSFFGCWTCVWRR